jgi:hypothetical protein
MDKFDFEIVEGMDVYDSDGMRIGTVEGIHQGHGAEKANTTDIVTIADTVCEMIGKRLELSTILFMRLYEEGFLHVDRGLLRRDCVIFPSQIDDIGEESVYLNIEATEIVKL